MLFFLFHDTTKLAVTSANDVESKGQIKFIIVKNIRCESRRHMICTGLQIYTIRTNTIYSTNSHILFLHLVQRRRVHYVELIWFDANVILSLIYFSPIHGSPPFLASSWRHFGCHHCLSLNEFLRLHLQNRYIIVCDKMRFSPSAFFYDLDNTCVYK